MSFKSHFSRFSSSQPGRLHFAAHSHHPWPDVSFAAHQRAWLDAAAHHDDKWDVIFGDVLPEAQRHVAAELGLSDFRSLVFAPNTHEFVLRLLSCLPERPRIVTSDAEFHSFERQTRRLEEEGLVTVTRVPAEPFATFPERLVSAAREASAHLVFVSHVFFNSGAMVRDVEAMVRALPGDALVVLDGYHGFCAVPTSLTALEARCFYVSGGYKYAMAGEGACFLHVPPGRAFRPRNTGWFAAFGALQDRQQGQVPYAAGAAAFQGATFEPSGLYRLNAVMRWRQQVGLSTAVTRAHAHALQRRFVAGLGASHPVRPGQLVVPLDDDARGQFLTFRTDPARALCAAMKARHVVTDARDDRWRIGFGPYQDEADVDALLERLSGVTP
ncbi:MAG: aminotransferase class V-fold PLP-dependent enzyme [Myxococcaceae bacterium]|nr:aminotransferase class V-fold PLP-dependent enzyme [Myxococcaceae bacterium]MCA3014297.1 aminotransferase class V-fold PLP-dependent enzyme [Myxococcaceae bacterium]